MRCLRLWRDNPRALAPSNQPVEQEISSLLEWYLCECLHYGPRSLSEWWSDGVIHLEVHQRTLESFQLLGVTWIDCWGLAPFEIDVELYPLDDSCFAKTIIRLGTLDEAGRPQVFNRKENPSSILEKRPRRNQDWAIAIELTPPQPQ